jgi:hypothetical protein
VGRHVVGALDGVPIVGLVFGHHLVEVALQVPPDSGGRVFVDRERGRGVLEEDVQQPDADLRQFGKRADHRVGHEVKAAGLGIEREGMLDPIHG